MLPPGQIRAPQDASGIAPHSRSGRLLVLPSSWRRGGPEAAPWRADLAAAAPPWLVARVLVFGTIVAARTVLGWLPRLPEPMRRHIGQGLLGWDAERYLQIATSGYHALPRADLRFFPFLPILVRLVDTVLPGGPGWALLALANGAALVAGMVLHRLASEETDDPALARRAAWAVALFPAGFVLAWGYTESLWLALSAGCVLALRRRRWPVAAVLGLAAGLLRPVGMLLAVPAAIEVLSAARMARPRWAPVLRGGVLAVAAPVAGALSYLAWVGRSFGDPLLPFTIQQSQSFRGAPTDPVRALWHPAVELARGDLSVTTVRVGWALLLVLLLVVVVRRWPASYGAFAGVLLAVALSTSRLGSFERYSFTTFPFLLAVATVTRRAVVERVALAVGAGAFALYGFLALLGAYVP